MANLPCHIDQYEFLLECVYSSSSNLMNPFLTFSDDGKDVFDIFDDRVHYWAGISLSLDYRPNR